MKLAALILLLSIVPARAADYMIVLNDNEKKVLIDILDEATKARGLVIAGSTLHFLNKVQTAPVVTERKEDPPKPVEAPKP